MLSDLLRGLKNPPDPTSDQSSRWRPPWLDRSLPPLPKSSGPQEETMFDYFRVPGVSTIHESKLVAWALFMGERNRIVSSPDRSVRPHRGMLPDIDPANAVLDPPAVHFFGGSRPSCADLAGRLRHSRLLPRLCCRSNPCCLSASQRRWLTLTGPTRKAPRRVRRLRRPITITPAPPDAAWVLSRRET